jgi:hypothetical protein
MSKEGVEKMRHIESCEVGKIKPSDHIHNWSGWPGAYCIICGIDDADELCLADSCKCPCHEEFWNQYNKFMEAHANE